MQTRPEPFVRKDTEGKWLHMYQFTVGEKINLDDLTNMSWDTRKQAEDWVRWNNFDKGLYGKVIKNPHCH